MGNKKGEEGGELAALMGDGYGASITINAKTLSIQTTKQETTTLRIYLGQWWIGPQILGACCGDRNSDAHGNNLLPVRKSRTRRSHSSSDEHLCRRLRSHHLGLAIRTRSMVRQDFGQRTQYKYRGLEPICGTRDLIDKH